MTFVFRSKIKTRLKLGEKYLRVEFMSFGPSKTCDLDLPPKDLSSNFEMGQKT